MPNYNKSFNFRSGVQVDYDNFIVNSNGLVGIGTSVVSTYLFNVYGDTRVTGLTTTKNLQVSEVATVGFLTASQGIHVSSAVTATAFYGDGSTLSNIVGFSTNAWILNIAQTGLSTSLNIGIGTQALDAYDLVIGDDPLVSEGISFVGSTGNVYSSGIVTATSFSGSGAGLTALSAPQLTGTINNARLPANINVSGIITASLGFNGNLTGIASTAHSITNSADIRVNSINSGFSTTGISTVFTTSHVGTGGTAFAALNSGRIGIGTALPTSELQIRKASGSLLEVISDSGSARISIGQSVGVGNSTAVLRFGFASKTFDIINNDTGNINSYLHADTTAVGINTGKFRWIYGQTNDELMSLNYDGTLTATRNVFLGSSGISSVTVRSDLFVDGTVNGNITFPNIINNSNLYTTTGISTIQKLNVPGLIGINSSNPIAPLDAQSSLALFGSVAIGATTVSNTSASLVVKDFASFSSVGIGTTTLHVSRVGNEDVLIGSFQLHNDSFGIFNGSLLINSPKGQYGIGFGTDTPRSVLDFGLVGTGNSFAYFIPPSVTTSDRNIFANNNIGITTVEGAIIYNKTLKKHQGYGSTDGGVTFNWQDLY